MLVHNRDGAFRAFRFVPKMSFLVRNPMATIVRILPDVWANPSTIGLARARLFGRWLTIPVIHGWGEVEGKRIETSRPLGASGIWGIIPANIKPVIALWF